MVELKWQKYRKETGHLLHMTRHKDFSAHIQKVPGNKFRAFYKRGEVLQSFSRNTLQSAKNDVNYIYNNLLRGVYN